MYLVTLKTALVDALQQAFTAYPVLDLDGLNIGIEYPVKAEQFPCIWVNYSPTDDVQMIGINNREYLGDLPPSAGISDATHAGYVRGFAVGQASYTIGALSSLERDRIHDQMLRIGMLGEDTDNTSVFRTQIESNPYANIGMAFDKWHTTGENAAPGTPWGTDEMIYEITLSNDLQCEFYVEPTTGDLILLSEINLEEPSIFFEPPTAPPVDDQTWPGIGTPADL